MPPDFGSANILMGVIGAGAAVVYLVYKLQTTMPFVSNLTNSGKRSSEERMASLLKKYQEENYSLDAQIRDISSSSPQLQLIRTAHQEGELTCLIVNRGGTATHLEVEAMGALRASIEPVDALVNGQAGSVLLSSIKSDINQLQFQLSYNDSLGMRVNRKYVYSEDDKKFIEI